jgi:malate dehydrogenase (oxaloacetate-decarboxylating)(NADP+)
MRGKANEIREAVEALDKMKLDFEYDGELSADVALNPLLRKLYPFCKLSGPANILIMPGLHAASISSQLLQELSAGVFIGPILNGFEFPVQIVHMGSSASDLLKIAAFAAVESINNLTNNK